MRPAPSVYEDTGVDKFGSWTTGSFASASGGTTTYSQTAGDGVNFAFYGAGVSLVFARATNRGYAKITIDGNDMGTIDQYGSSTQWQQRVDFGGFANGYHVINVTAAGAKQGASSGYFVDVDGFQVSGGCLNTACRAWAIQSRFNYGHYFGAKATLTYGIPAVRDGKFSAEVLWMGDINDGYNYIEIGWRRTAYWTIFGTQENQTRMYWGYWDQNRQWHGPDESQYWLGDYTTTHNLEIRKISSDSSGATLAVYADGVERGRAYFPGLNNSNTGVAFGGEVSDYGSGVRNAMGVGDFSNLQFDDGFGYVNWPQDSVNVPTVMYNYQSVHIADGHWQAYGYN